MKYLRVDHSEVENNAHLARLMWPDSVDQPYEIHLTQFYAVPQDHANVAFIACLVQDQTWYDYPGMITEPRQVRLFA
jgi:hypothetical protein